jgi:hypothetical protein
MLRNQEKVTDARIFRMEEVPIEFRAYYKVEVVIEQDETPAPATAPLPAPPIAPAAPVPPSVANAMADTPPADDVPLDPMPVEVAAAKARRFGRN